MSPHRLLPSLQDRCDQRFRWTSSRAANATADRAGHRPWGPRRPGLVDAPSRCWWAPHPWRSRPRKHECIPGKGDVARRDLSDGRS